MKTWLTVILFLVAMFLDAIILPAFFGFKENFLSVIFIVVVILYHKLSFRTLFLGVALSGWAEFYWRLKFGTMILPFLASMAVLFFLNRFFNIKNGITLIICGVIMFIVFWEVSILINIIY